MNALNIIDDYIEREQLARALNCSPRTLARYETQPDGLASLMVAGRKFYRKQAVVEFFARREVKPNPRRT